MSQPDPNRTDHMGEYGDRHINRTAQPYAIGYPHRYIGVGQTRTRNGVLRIDYYDLHRIINSTTSA